MDTLIEGLEEQDKFWERKEVFSNENRMDEYEFESYRKLMEGVNEIENIECVHLNDSAEMIDDLVDLEKDMKLL